MFNNNIFDSIPIKFYLIVVAIYSYGLCKNIKLMNITFILDASNVILIFMGIITTILTGILSEKMRISHSFGLSLGFVFIFSFIVANFITTINQLRIIVLSFILFAVIPLTISFLMVWISKESLFRYSTTISRVQLSSFVGWWSGATLIMLLRLPLGWGYDSFLTLIIVGLLLSVLMGIISGIIGLGILKQSEKIHPST